jgi:general secretion pathway protein G
MNSKRVKKGFTIVEIMAVLVIIGLLATMVGTTVIKQIEKAKVETTKANLKTLQSAVNSFFMDVGRLPTQEEGLEALVVQPTDAEKWDPSGYLDSTKLPKDGWRTEFKYSVAPESGKPFEIRSAGPDKEFYTDDDLVSTNID